MKNEKEKSATDAKQEKVHAKYSFTGDELVELGREAGRHQQESESLDRQLSSIKKDFQSKIEASEMRRNNAFSKLSDGFEMREYDAMIVFNRPKKGLKSVYHLDVEQPYKLGVLIREETMTAGDCQAELFAQQRNDDQNEKISHLPNPVIEK